MADAAIVARALLASAGGATNSTFNTASITPAPNQLVLVRVASAISGGAPAAPTLSGNSLTYVQIASVASPSGDRRLTLFRAMGSAPTAGAITIDFGGVTQTTCRWDVCGVGGVDTSGSNGAGAIVQAVTNTASATTAFSVTLAAFGSSSNRPFGFALCETNATISLESGYVDLNANSTATAPAYMMRGEYKETGTDTSVSFSRAANDNWAGIAIEVAAMVPGSAAAEISTPFTGAFV